MEPMRVYWGRATGLALKKAEKKFSMLVREAVNWNRDHVFVSEG